MKEYLGEALDHEAGRQQFKTWLFRLVRITTWLCGVHSNVLLHHRCAALCCAVLCWSGGGLDRSAY
jgi:hypothetical protein